MDYTEEQMKEMRLKKFQSMNIPMPITQNVSVTGVNKVKDPRMLQRMEEIKRGAFKHTYTDIVNKPRAGESRLPDLSNPDRNKQRQNPEEKTTVKPPPLFEEAPVFNADLFEVEKLLGDSSMSDPRQMQQRQQPQPGGIRMNENMYAQPDDGGASFVQETRQKFHSNMQQKLNSQRQQQYYQQPPVDQYYQQPAMQPAIPYNQQPAPTVVMPQLQQGLVVFNEEDLKKKIISYATQVAKKVSQEMIKSVLNEYLNQTKTPIVESNNVKKAEIVGENIVKIEGQIFKLVPAQPKAPAKKVSE